MKKKILSGNAASASLAASSKSSPSLNSKFYLAKFDEKDKLKLKTRKSMATIVKTISTVESTG
jgi:hypothetical protein